jgi:hypothetical protein
LGNLARLVAAVLAVLWGATLAVASAAGVPDALAAQHLLDGARPLVMADYLARERAFIAEGNLAQAELTGTALPRLADRLGISADGLRLQIGARYADVATGLERIPAILTTTDVALANLQRHRGDFLDADAYPAGGTPRIVDSIAGMLAGLVLAGLGVAVLRTRSWRPLAAVLALAAVGVVLPLAFSLPHRAEGVHAMVVSLNLTEQTAQRTRQSFDVVQRFDAQLDGRLLPDAAAELGTTPAALADQVTAGLGSLQALRRDYPTILATFRPNVDLREAAAKDFPRIKDVPVVALTWVFIGVNAAIALAAAAGLALRRRPGE